jgi:hypothetical protein
MGAFIPQMYDNYYAGYNPLLLHLLSLLLNLFVFFIARINAIYRISNQQLM